MLRRSLGGVILLYVAVVLSWLLVLPPLEGPDEFQHYDYARYVAVTGHLPDRVPASVNEGGWYTHLWIHEGLYYWLYGQALRAMGVQDAAPAVPNPRASFTGGPEAPLLLHAPPLDGPVARGLIAGRIANALLGLGTIVCVFLALTYATGEPRLGALGAGCLVLVPEFGVRHAFVSNDPLALFCASLAALLVMRWLPRSARAADAARSAAVLEGARVRDDARGGTWLKPWWHAALIGLVTGCAIASKLTAGVVVLLMPIAWWLARREVPLRRLVPHVVAWSVGLAATGAWPFVRNWILFGDPLALAMKRAIVRQFDLQVFFDATNPHSYVEVGHRLITSFWANVGWAGFHPPVAWVWAVYGGITLLCVAAVPLAWLVRSTPGSRDPGDRRDPVITLATIIVIVNLLAFFASISRVPGHSARYLLPITLPALVLVMASCRTVVHAVRLRVGVPATDRSVSWLAWLVVTALAAAWIATLREVVLAFHFGATAS